MGARMFELQTNFAPRRISVTSPGGGGGGEDTRRSYSPVRQRSQSPNMRAAGVAVMTTNRLRGASGAWVGGWMVGWMV
jgi:hypothetical protein